MAAGRHICTSYLNAKLWRAFRRPVTRWPGCVRSYAGYVLPHSAGYSQPGMAEVGWGTTLIARFMGPTWGPSGADRTQVGPMLAPWTLLSRNPLLLPASLTTWFCRIWYIVHPLEYTHGHCFGQFWISMFMSVWRICCRLWHCGLSPWQPARRRRLSDRYYDDVIPSV